MIRPRSPIGALIGFGVAGAALVVGAGMLLFGSDDDEDADVEASGPVRIRAKGSRDRPRLDLLAGEVATQAEADDPSVPPAQRSAADRLELLERQRIDRAAQDPDLQRIDQQAPTTDPNDVDVMGRAPAAPSTAGGASSAAAVASANLLVDPSSGAGDYRRTTDPTELAKVLGTPAANPKPPPSDPPIIDSGLPRDVITRYVRRATPDIRRCYLDGLADHPGLQGTVQVTFTIANDGTVASATATGLDDGVATCIAGVIRAIHFPHPDGDGTVTVRYPFVFRPA